RGACRGKQTRLTSVGLTDQRGLRDGLELEIQRALLAGLALLGDARRAAGAGREVGIAGTAAATARAPGAVTGAHQVRRQAVVAGDVGTRRNGQHQVVPGLAVLARAAAGRAALRLELALLRKVEQCGDALRGNQVHAAATATVTTVR